MTELISCKLTGNPSHSLTGNSFPHLRHLSLDRLDLTLDPAPSVVFPLVTHLSLTNLDFQHSNLAPTFPNLTYLKLTYIICYITHGIFKDVAGFGGLVPIRAPSLTHFAIDDALHSMRCRALPTRLPELSLKADVTHDFDDIREHWENEDKEHPSRPGKLILRTHESLQSTSGRRLLRDLDARPALLALRQAGCEVEYRYVSPRKSRKRRQPGF